MEEEDNVLPRVGVQVETTPTRSSRHIKNLGNLKNSQKEFTVKCIAMGQRDRQEGQTHREGPGGSQRRASRRQEAPRTAKQVAGRGQGAPEGRQGGGAGWRQGGARWTPRGAAGS